MGALKDRLRRVERTLRVGDLDAELERMTDEELEDRIRELLTIMEGQAVAEGHTVGEFRAAMDADNAAKGMPPHDWNLLG